MGSQPPYKRPTQAVLCDGGHLTLDTMAIHSDLVPHPSVCLSVSFSLSLSQQILYPNSDLVPHPLIPVHFPHSVSLSVISISILSLFTLKVRQKERDLQRGAPHARHFFFFFLISVQPRVQ